MYLYNHQPEEYQDTKFKQTIVFFLQIQMDYPFYRTYYPVREVPVRRETAPERNVIHVPVTDGSQRRRRTDSAVKIQKVLRGFLVRKSVKKIADIRREVNEIEKRISSKETVELIGKDSKERLKINEMLMRSLIQLDSVRGVDSGVRDCRKAVIKKAIRLQEMVDSIADHCETLEQEAANPASISNSVDKKLELQNTAESADDVDQKLQNKCEFKADASEDKVMPEAADGKSEGNEEEDGSVSGSECAESMELSQDESETGSSANPRDDNNGEPVEKHENQQDECGGGGKEVSRKSIQLVEKLIEDNERMMGLMADLFKRNERQMQLLSSLSFRVEQLERAFMCEKSRRKKKRNSLKNLDKD